MKKFLFSVSFVFIIILLLIFQTGIKANSGGKSGRTKKTSGLGCGSCHTYNSSVASFFTTPDTVIAGQTYNNFLFTITATGATGKIGCNIASKYGSLSVPTGNELKLMNGELVQSSGYTYVNPKVLTFGYTAPNTSGTDTLFGVADRGYTGGWDWTPNKVLVVILSSGIINNEIPVSYYLKQNYPNPFNPSTKIEYGIKKNSNVRISLYDISGKEIGTLVDEYQNAGNYYIDFNASKFNLNLSSGIYYYKMSTNSFTDIKKMIFIK